MYKSKGIKQVSTQKVKDYFIKNKIAIKRDISNVTKLSLATITNILKQLLEEGFIIQIEDSKSTGGRKAKRYQIAAECMYFGLIDLQVYQNKILLYVKVTDLNQSVVLNRNETIDEMDTILLLSIINQIYKHYRFNHIAISIPGIVDQNGYITKCDIDGLEECNLKEEIEKNIPINVSIENDVNTALLGYINVNDVIKRSIAFVYQPDNHHTGCSLFINNAIVYGNTNFAGELAYLPYGSLKEQEELLKKKPLDLLVKQVTSVIAIVNPSDMVLFVPCVNEKEFKKTIELSIPKKHLPKFVFIDCLNDFVFQGLQRLCIENSRFTLNK